MDRKTAIDSLVEAVMEKGYGEVLGFDEIGEIIGRKHGTVSYNDILQTARRRLISAGHMIVNVRGVGYRVCEPDGYTGEGVRYMMQGARRIDRGSRIVRHAPVNAMSQQAREAHNRVSDRMTRLCAAMAGASVEIHMLSSSGSSNPLLAATGNARREA